MKTIMALLVALLLAIATNAQTAGMQPMLTSYLKLKEALVNSDPVKAATFASELGVIVAKTETGNLKPAEKKVFEREKANLIRLAQKTGKITDLEEQRVVFADLSVVVWKIMKQAKSITGNVYYQYCPMKQVYWVSSDAAIRNPYYGAKMLTCGSISEKK